MNEEQYIAERLDKEIAWYYSKSTSNQRTFRFLRMTEICLAAFIAVLAGLIAKDFLSWATLIAVLGALVTILSSVIGLNKYQEHWIQYRTTCESLRKEKHLYLTKTDPFDGTDRFQILVKRVETLISTENTNWSQFMSTTRKDNQHGN